MTDDERALLIKTAQALGSLTQLCASGAGMHDFNDLLGRINRSIAPLVDKLSGCTCQPVSTNLPHLSHLATLNQGCPLHGTVTS